MLRALYAYGLSLVLIALVASPPFRDPPEDSFPFSDYPMFSHGRPTPMLTITQMLGVDEEGVKEPLSPTITSGSYEVMQAMMSISIGHQTGGARYCAEVAERVALDDDLGHVVWVEIATGTWDTVAYFEEGPEPIERVVHERCLVPR